MDDVSHHCYVPEFVPCPDCHTCEKHSHLQPKLTARTTYWRVFVDGTRQELTKEEYAKRMELT